MPIEIKVGPPVITISQGRTFMVTDQRAECLLKAKAFQLRYCYLLMWTMGLST